MTTEITDEEREALLDDIRDAIESDETERLRNLLDRFKPEDLAQLTEFFDSDEKAAILRALPEVEAGDFLHNLSAESLRDIAELNHGAVGQGMKDMEPDEVADVLDVLPEEAARAVLESLPRSDARIARHLLEYESDTAGGRMTPEFVVLNQNITASEAVSATQASRDQETIAHLFVTDDDGVLVGYLPLYRLVFAHPGRKLADLMEEPTTVGPDMDEEEVVQIATKYDLAIVPVVDEAGRPLGVITADDILDAARAEADEDIYALAGTAEVDPVHSSVYRGVLLRLPWLMLSLIDGLFIAFLSSRFEYALEIVGIAFFIPLIPLMGGNVAVQSSTIVVRAMAVGGIRPQTVADFAKRQVFVVLLLALSCGGIAGLMSTVMINTNVVRFMLVVGGSVGLAITTAGSMGLGLPFVFRKIGIDPAVSAGPFVTMLNDVFCIFIYLTLATLLLY